MQKYLLIGLLFLAAVSHGQTPYIPADTLEQVHSPLQHRQQCLPQAGSFILPALALSYGSLSLFSTAIREFDYSVQDLGKYRSHPLRVDDYLQYVPAVSGIGLQLMGIKGKHQLRDRSIMLGMSTALTILSVRSLKYIVGRQRPDSYARNSFPSGHTATAFVGATFLWMEYKDSHPWIGIAGYSLAVGTGILRVYNNRHWFSDVVMGAGLGMLNVRLAYWLYPSLQRLLFKQDEYKQVMLSPWLSDNGYGMSVHLQL